MRKTMNFLIAVLLTGSISAQQLTTDEVFRFDGKAPIDLKALQHKMSMRATKEAAIGWMIPSWDLLDYYYLETAAVSHYANVIFPDSTVIYESGGILNWNWLNSVGGVFDPYSEMYDSLQSLPLIDISQPYRIDSIFVLGWYEQIDGSVVDTLVLELVSGEATVTPEFAWSVFSFPSDTFNVSPPKVLGSTTQKGYLCRMTAPSKTVIKYPLTSLDSTNNLGKYITIPVNYNVAAGDVVGLSVTFVPGMDYAQGDILFSYSDSETPVMNSFRAGLYATDDTGTDPFIFAEPYFHWSSHHYIKKEVRYSTYTGTNSWRNERMVSTVSWGFDIGYYVTNMWTGNANVNNQEVNIWPNPVSGILNIENVSKGSQFRIMNVSGALVQSGSIQDEHESINLQQLNNGLYFIEFLNEEGISTHKIILNR